EFGDSDGDAAKARLHDCRGIVAWKDGLLVADTLNHKIRHIDPRARTSRTLAGGAAAEPNHTDALVLSEPDGLSVANDRLYIADTDNQRIVAVDLTSNLRWTEVRISGLDPP